MPRPTSWLHAPKAEEVAVSIDVNLARSESSRQRHPDLDGQHIELPETSTAGKSPVTEGGVFELQPIHPEERVHEGEVIRDIKTGKHYKKIPVKKPAYSLSHTQGAPVLAAQPIRKTGRIGLGHAFPTQEQHQQYKAEKAGRSNNGSGSKTPVDSSARSAHRSSMDVNTADGRNALFQQLRELIHEEVLRASQVQTQEMRKHVEDANEEQHERIKEHLEEHKEGVKDIVVADARSGNPEYSDQTLQDTKETNATRVDMDSASNEKKQLSFKDRMGTQLQDDDDDPIKNPKPAERGYDGSDQTLGESYDDDSSSEELGFPNKWAEIRYKFREPFAEFLGCFMLMVFGNGINCQVTISALYDPTSPKGDYLSISFGWGVGVAMGVWVAGGISGGMINPAVTISLAIFRKFPWKKVPIYITAQILGCLFGSLCIYGLYVNPIRLVDPGQTETTASLFTTYPAEFLRSPSTRMSSFYNEFFASAVLLIVILAIGDSSNTPPPDGMAPIVLLWLVWGLGACLGWQTAYAVNPARDLGPRLMLYIVGYSPDLLWTFDAWYWIWTPILATISGAIMGCFMYDTLCYTGGDSPLNARTSHRSVKFQDGSKKKMPAALTEA